MHRETAQDRSRLAIAAAAAFCTYFCMYAFRKPFSAALYADSELGGYPLKSVLVVSQLFGYMLSKFIGIRVISEMRPQWRARAIIGLIAVAELALVAFCYLPLGLKPAALFLNGLPLGMVFGLVLSYLEGRRQTEALSAVLCGSFILSSGVVKSVGRWLIEDWGVSEFSMPMLTGLLFLGPLLIAVRVLEKTPQRHAEDIADRSPRLAMSSEDRRAFIARYGLVLSLLVVVYVALTVARTIRDDFAKEIFLALGVSRQPEIFAQTELVVAFVAVTLAGLGILLQNNRTALRVTFSVMGGAFVLVVGAVFLQGEGFLTPFVFMVLAGIGLYIPYVSFHTTVFERMIAVTRQPCNLGFLMYIADALGYLASSIVLAVKPEIQQPQQIVMTLRVVLVSASLVSVAALIPAALLLLRKTVSEVASGAGEGTSPMIGGAAAVEWESNGRADG